MTSWIQGLVPGSVKRALNALYPRACEGTASQAHSAAAPLSPEQPVAPALNPPSSCTHQPPISCSDMPGMVSDSDSSSDSDDGSPYIPSRRHSKPAATRRAHSIDSTASDTSDDTAYVPAPSARRDDNQRPPPQPLPRHRSPTPTQRRPLRSNTPAPRHAAPVTKISWREWVGCAPPPTTPPAALSDEIINSAAALLKDVHSTIICDGSKTQARMGLGFITHHHRSKQTRIFAKPLDLGPDNNSMLAETLTLTEALTDAQCNKSDSVHIVTDSRTLRQLALGREQFRGAEKLGKHLADANQKLVTLLRSFEAVYISHVAAHKKLLHENSIADLLAGLASEHCFEFQECVLPENKAAILTHINSMHVPRNSVRATSIPHLHQHATPCEACHCPSHTKQSCVLNNIASFPSLSTYCRNQPCRPPSFAEQINDPAIIDWSTAPACISYADFTRFFATCVNCLRRQQSADGALHALKQFAATYRVINGHISKYKRPKDHNPHPPDDSESHYKKLAANAKTAARLARDLRFHDAMKMLDKQQPVGPLCPEAIHQLPSLYPSKQTEAHIPSSSPEGRRAFDRHAVHRYVTSRDSTSSPGISGLGFNWIQLFARLTIAQESDESEDPNWTIFIAFLEDFACGALPWLRHWATELKGALFNKSPDTAVIKLRNLGIAESFVRIAAFMVMSEAMPHARAKQLISAFDFGVAVPGGCEKFVKLAQAAAASGCTIVSCDLEKAFNNVLRKDLWETVQLLNCPLLTSWFCFFYQVPPRVHFASDPTIPFTMGSVVTYTLHEGVAQGDPLSSFLFVCTLSRILESHRISFPDFIRMTVIDDICFVTSPSRSACVPSALANLSATLLNHNLVLNNSKTTVYSNEGSFPIPPSFPYVISNDGFSVCRIHVGTVSFCNVDMSARLQKITASETSFQRLYKALDFCQTPGRGLIFVDLLRLCFRSRFSWDMRTLPPHSACHIAKAADAALRTLLRLVLPRHPLPTLPREWTYLERIHDIKLNLPLVKGGLGLRSWCSLLEATHFSSWIESGPCLFQLFDSLRLDVHPSILVQIGDSVSYLSSRFTMPDDFWRLDAKRYRNKVQHEITELLDDAEIAEASSLSHDPAINAQFRGSITPSMSLPFNSCLIPRHILDRLDTYNFSYALAWHTMMPLFQPSACSCSKLLDPLGLHAASCLHLNAYNLLHNSVRDCFAGAARARVAKDPHSQVAYILTDKHAKSATWMHEFYPLKQHAPAVIHRNDPTRTPAPSLSPDILIAFTNDPLNPYFGDFVAASPSTVNKLKHKEAAQVAFTEKLQHYFKHHSYPHRVCYPLAFERSGYLHPAFEDFVDLYSRCSTTTQPQPQIALQLRFAVAFAITFTTASLLRAASLRLLPHTLLPFLPPKPIPVPTCWAPTLPSPTSPRFTSSFAPPPPNNDSTREQTADTSLRAFARRDRSRLGMGCAGDSPAQSVLAGCASTSESGGILTRDAL